MKLRKYYHCTITTHEGRVFENPLLLKEIHLIGTIARENKNVLVEVREIDEETYKTRFTH